MGTSPIKISVFLGLSNLISCIFGDTHSYGRMYFSGVRFVDRRSLLSSKRILLMFTLEKDRHWGGEKVSLGGPCADLVLLRMGERVERLKKKHAMREEIMLRLIRYLKVELSTR